MVSAADGSGSSGGDGGDVNFRLLLGKLSKGAGLILGGIFSLTMISSAATSFILHKKDQYGDKKPCDVCKGKGFYICKLCKGNATIKWSPLYDPVFINPCLCPTCDGRRIQRCLNCLGNGFIRSAKG